ncbi:hypothetical protein BU16DRAFT_566805 [Lophium mytilinum]|uniref:Uncharacterized protein n=1 Tax=Lophium mytilinum TaxID=390894 RepID=A0A6A6QCG9_9PEZI|nr:hypothetical protein BU16DRAFT_566805 [Lophium mytilinum]
MWANHQAEMNRMDAIIHRTQEERLELDDEIEEATSNLKTVQEKVSQVTAELTAKIQADAASVMAEVESIEAKIKEVQDEHDLLVQDILDDDFDDGMLSAYVFDIWFP